jgi:hypothetical protein
MQTVAIRYVNVVEPDGTLRRVPMIVRTPQRQHKLRLASRVLCSVCNRYVTEQCAECIKEVSHA